MNTTRGEEKLLNVDLIINKADIAEGMKVADFGCGGAAHFIVPLARVVGKGGRVYAIDILKNVLENVDRKIKVENIHNVKTVWSDLEIFKGTKIEAGSLDAILLVNTLYQSKQRASVLREAIRTLKKGGKIVIVEWKKITTPFGPKREERVDDKNLAKVAEKQGLELEEEFYVGSYHYGLIFHKI